MLSMKFTKLILKVSSATEKMLIEALTVSSKLKKKNKIFEFLNEKKNLQKKI